MPVLSKRIVLDCFYLLIFYSEKFSTDVCRLPYAVNVNLNLSIRKGIVQLATSLGYVFLLFPMKVAGAHAHGNQGKYLVPGS